MNIAIIGAGLSGLAAADRLHAAGHTCVIFDKSRGVGGRMATRRVGPWQFDHGAQYFTARGAAFSQQTKAWEALGVAAEWFDGAFVGAPEMNAPMRSMAANMKVLTGCEVSRFHRSASGWRVHSAEGVTDAPGNGAYDGLILAIPSPQADALLRASDFAIPELAGVRYAPCWAAMMGFDTPLNLELDRWRPAAHDIGWLARDGAKPGRSGETLVAHANPQWSRQNLEMSPEDALSALLRGVSDLIGKRLNPAYAVAHRWRYALVEEALGSPCLWRSDLKLGLCGDWCLGPRVECAFDSGLAVAQALLGHSP